MTYDVAGLDGADHCTGGGGSGGGIGGRFVVRESSC